MSGSAPARRSARTASSKAAPRSAATTGSSSSPRSARCRRTRSTPASRPTLEIGDRNTIREYCNFNIGTAQDAGTTRVGDDNWLMNYVHIAHDCVVGSQTIIAGYAGLAGHVHARRLGDRRRDERAAPVRARRRARDDRLPGPRVARRAAVHDGRRPSARGARLQCRGAAPARLLGRAHRRRQADAPSALPRRPRPSTTRGHGSRRSRRACPRRPTTCAWSATSWRRPREASPAERGPLPMTAESPRFAMVAGEASGDLLGGLTAGRACARAGRSSSPRASAARRWPRTASQPGGRTTSCRYAATSRCSATSARSSAIRNAARRAAARRQARCLHRHRRARLQPRRRAEAEGARRQDDPLHQPVDLGLARQANREDRPRRRPGAVHLSVRARDLRQAENQRRLRRPSARQRDPVRGAARRRARRARHRRRTRRWSRCCPAAGAPRSSMSRRACSAPPPR